MTRTTLLAIAATVFLSTFNPSAALAQDDDCLVYYNRVDEETGETIRVCAQNARQTTVATAFVGSIDRARGVTSFVSPNRTSATVSPAVDAYPILWNDRRGGYYESPRDPRPEWAILDAVLDGVTVTAFKDKLRRAEADGIRDGQHAAEMAAIESLRAEIARQRSYLAGAIAAGNADLERKFGVRIADLERQLAAVQAPEVKPKPAPGGAGSGGGKSEQDKEAERRAERMAFCRENPEECRARGATVQDYFDRRIPQSRRR